MISPKDIEAEHQEALATLTREQRWALSRLQRATQASQFNHKKIADNLDRIFEDEAVRRNEANEESQARRDKG